MTDTSQQRANRFANRIAIVATVLNVIGLGLALYLTIEHYSATPSYACPVNSVLDCAKVTSSSYSSFMGVPVAPMGLVYFLVSIPLHLPVAWRSTVKWVGIARWVWVALGMASVFWLIRAELELEAMCLYCTGVHVVTFLLLVLVALGSGMRPIVIDDDDAAADTVIEGDASSDLA